MSLLNILELAKRSGLTQGTTKSYIGQMSIRPETTKLIARHWVSLYSSKAIAKLKDKAKRVKAKNKVYYERLQKHF